MLLALNVHDSRRADNAIAKELQVSPAVPVQQYHDGFGNLCTRLVAPASLFSIHSDCVVRDSGWTDLVVPDAAQVPVYQLPDETLVYLLGSRYCETDKLAEQAWDLFGTTPNGWARVQAICDYVHARIQFGYEFADAPRGAAFALEQGRGVCRDFAHSAVALCRCMNIPARYRTGYIGDFGVAPSGTPMDSSE